MNHVASKYRYWVKCIAFHGSMIYHFASAFEFDHEFNSSSINMCTEEFKSQLATDYNIEDPNNISVVIEFFGRLHN